MSISPTGTNSLVQNKPDRQTVATEISDSTSQTAPAEQVTPTAPTPPLGEISQESQTDQQTSTRPGQSQQRIEIQSAVEKLNSFMKSMERDLEFDFNEDLGRTVVTVRDATTQEVVRKLPSETAIKLAKILQENELKSADVPTGQLLDIKT